MSQLIALCMAHGKAACPDCSRIMSGGLAEDGTCRGCSVYAEIGMHWDTCSERLRGDVLPNYAAALADMRREAMRADVRQILVAYSSPSGRNEPTWEGLNSATEKIVKRYSRDGER